MQVTNSRKPGPVPAKANFRDKRYVVPNLLVDLLSGSHETTLWSATQVILRDVADLPAQDEVITGALSFAQRPDTTGLFQARVARLDPARKLVGASFEWLNEPAEALIRDMLAERKPDAPDDAPVMKVTIAHQTINWSLTGMLVARYRGDLQTGQPFRGLIRLEKAQDPGPFYGSVIRADSTRETLAVKFQDLPPKTFALLETAIKKSNAN
jgi:hypothetical protein